MVKKTIEKQSTESTQRREFLKKSALTLGGVTIMPYENIFGSKKIWNEATQSLRTSSYAPSEKVNLACIGIGHRGGRVVKDLYNTGLANIVALCDVDMEAEHTLEIIKMFPDVPRFKDFRQMFDKMGSQIEAVTVGTPDFSHFPITMLAMSLGKHVYVEKPLARTFNEVELLMAAAKKHGVVTQMGNQGHSGENYFQFKAWKEAGIIKDVTAITAHMNKSRRWHKFDPLMTSLPKQQPIPGTLDWDVWLNTSQDHDFNKDYHHGQWRCWYDFGMGALGDWGAHILDTAHEFLELGLPYEINPTYLNGHNSFFFPFSSTIEFKFGARGNMPPVDVTWKDGLDNVPTVPEGYMYQGKDVDIPAASNKDEAGATLQPGKIIYSKELTFQGGTHSKPLMIVNRDKYPDLKLPEVPVSPSDHFANFLLACKGEEKARSSFEISGPLSQVFALGVAAQRMGSKLIFDKDTRKFTNNVYANELLDGLPPRKGWEEFYKL
tara:strand:- start:39694 stop:41169 length:1476 start_codon:yes stop_codon:yes gene_type:complete